MWQRKLIGAVRPIALVLGIGFMCIIALAGCVMLKPLPPRTSVEKRIEAFPARDLPIRKAVTVHWETHMIPFIEAQTDEDLAFALGMVHAHLRLGQMEIYRRIAHGRLAEMFGPSLASVDHSLRILNLGRASNRIYRDMPDETRRWLDEFVRGINCYIERTNDLPHEFSVGALRREAWTPQDVITLARLAGADINWMVWFFLLRVRGTEHYPALLARLLREAAASTPSFSTESSGLSLEGLLGGVARAGSNSIAVAASRSKTGGAILANDPHLGLSLPNPWIIVGCKSPSYHFVGLMFPGLPFAAIGRNPRIAWGGTNMRAACSELYEISSEAPYSILTRRETIRVRWWLDRKITVRESRLGPIISDAPILADSNCPTVALRWTGHDTSDEFTAILRANRARNWTEFREAFRGYAVPGMNVLYADLEGNIGQLMAVRLPVRSPEPPVDILSDAADPKHEWRGFKGPDELPFAFNPPSGILVSANNLPARINPPVGWFFSPNDRVERLTSLLSAEKSISPERMMTIQRDVFSPTDDQICRLFVEVLQACGLRERFAKDHPALFEALRSWDGRYTADSADAARFQIFLCHFAERYCAARYGKRVGNLLLTSGYARPLLKEELGTAPPAVLAPLLLAAAEAAEKQMPRYAAWGDMHRVRLSHIFGNIPVIGFRYGFADHPGEGANETVHKTAHRLTPSRHYATYGSTARHVSDLSHPDANWFVILGGQDGRLRSDAATDQVPVWMVGQYVQVPLTTDQVRVRFPFKTQLRPTSSP